MLAKLKPWALEQKVLMLFHCLFFGSGFTSPRTSWISHHTADLRFLCLLILLKKKKHSAVRHVWTKNCGTKKPKLVSSTDADATSYDLGNLLGGGWISHLKNVKYIYTVKIGSLPKSFWDPTWLLCWETGNHHRVMWKWHFMARGPPDWRIRVCLNIWGPV